MLEGMLTKGTYCGITNTTFKHHMYKTRRNHNFDLIQHNIPIRYELEEPL